MARNNYGETPITETKTEMPVQGERISFMAFDTKISIYPAGTFTDKKTGKLVTFPAGITLKSPGMQFPAKLAARTLVAIFHKIEFDQAVRNVLKTRMAEEKSQEKDL